MFSDFRYALRLLRKSPGFTAAAVLALTLGIGANTAIFSFVYAYMLRPLPYPDPGRIVLVSSTNPRAGIRGGVPYADFYDWRRQSRGFAELAAESTVSMTLTGGREPERIEGMRVTEGFFRVFGVTPAAGRTFNTAEDAPGGPPVAILSHGFWQRRLGGAPNVLGRDILLDEQPYTVIGILPPGFRYLTDEAEYFLPLAMAADRGAPARASLGVFGRLKPGVSVAAASAELNTIARRLALAYPDTNSGTGALVETLREVVVAGPRPSMYILMCAVGFVLLIACANVANLLLARATARARELTLRAALGAGRWRIVRHMLAESLLIAWAGGAGGLLAARWWVAALVAGMPRFMLPVEAVTVDRTVLLFTAGLALLTGILAGLGPALQASTACLNEDLKEAGRGGGRAGRRTRSVLVVAEISLSLVLLVGATLMIKSFLLLHSADPGYRVEGLLTAEVPLPPLKYPDPEQRSRFFDELLRRVAALPGVESASASSALPVYGGGGFAPVGIEGRAPVARDERLYTRTRSVTPGHFHTLGLRLTRGRYFSLQDRSGAPAVAIINETMARSGWPGQDPVGRRFRLGSEPDAPWVTVAGVVRDLHSAFPGSQTVPETYLPHAQNPSGNMFLLVRTRAGDPARLAPAVRAEVYALDRDQAVADLRTLAARREEVTSVPRVMSGVMAVFAAVALFLAVMGVYGVISYSVAQRTREIGIRMALGAGRGAVSRMVAWQALALAAIGLLLGLALAWPLTRLMQSQLFGVTATDPLAFLGVPLLLAAAAGAAGYLPGRKAARLDPSTALRCE